MRTLGSKLVLLIIAVTIGMQLKAVPQPTPLSDATQAALRLLQNSNSSAQALGSSALAKAINSKTLDSQEIEAVAGQLEQLHTGTLNTALISAYSQSDKLRTSRLTSALGDTPSQADIDKFRLAAFAELQTGSGKLTAEVGNLPLSGPSKTRRALVRLMTAPQDPALAAAVTDLLNGNPTDLTDDDAILLLFTAMHPDFLATLPKPETAKRVSATLLALPHGKDLVLDRVRALSKASVVNLLDITPSPVSFDSLLTNAQLKPVTTSDQIGDRDVAVIPDPVKLVSDYTPYALCPSCDNVNPHHSEANSASLVSITGLYVDNNGSNHSFPSYSCFSGSDYGTGACFEKFVESRSYRGVSTVAFGIHNRAWLTGSFGRQRPAYTLRIGYTAGANSTWLAVRWSTNNGTSANISGQSGLLASVPVATERSSQWQLFPITPNQRIVLSAHFSANVYTGVDLHRFYTYGFAPSNANVDALEVLEITETNFTNFAPVLPLAINTDSAADPLLAYAAGQQAATLPNGWLETGTDSLTATLPELSYLQELGTLDLKPPLVYDPADPHYPLTDWKQRQRLALAAAPLLGFRQYNQLHAQVEQSIALSSLVLTRLLPIQSQLSNALSTLNTLSRQQLSDILGAYARTSSTSGGQDPTTFCSNAPGASTSLELLCLQTEVEGAANDTSDLLQSLNNDIRMSCFTLRMYKSQGVVNQLAITPTKEIVDLCEH
jgi:hypothetical protein